MGSGKWCSSEAAHFQVRKDNETVRSMLKQEPLVMAIETNLDVIYQGQDQEDGVLGAFDQDLVAPRQS